MTVAAPIEIPLPPHGLTPLEYKVMMCESSANPNAVGDHGTSFGLAQLHFPRGDGVTKEMALDPVFALNYLHKGMKDNPHQWSCYKIVTKHG